MKMLLNVFWDQCWNSRDYIKSFTYHFVIFTLDIIMNVEDMVNVYNNYEKFIKQYSV